MGIYSLWLRYVLIVFQISYVTVIAPYLLLIALVIRGVTLEGAGDGIRYYLLPDWTKLGVAKVRTSLLP